MIAMVNEYWYVALYYNNQLLENIITQTLWHTVYRLWFIVNDLWYMVYGGLWYHMVAVYGICLHGNLYLIQQGLTLERLHVSDIFSSYIIYWFLLKFTCLALLSIGTPSPYVHYRSQPRWLLLNLSIFIIHARTDLSMYETFFNKNF